MKKILILTTLLFLFSCSASNEKDDDLWNNIDIANINSNSGELIDDENKSLEIWAENTLNDKEILDKGLLEENLKNQLTKKLEESITTTLYNTNCYTEYDENKYTNDKDREFILSLQDKCMEEQENLVYESKNKRKQSIEQNAWINLEDCKKAALTKSKENKKLIDKNDKLIENSEESIDIEKEVEFCEQALAFKYGCDLFVEDNKMLRCRNNKDFYEKMKLFDQYEKYDINDYLK